MRRPGFDSQVVIPSWRRKWQPIPVFLPGESHGQRSLVGYSPWGCKNRIWLSNYTTTTILGTLHYAGPETWGHSQGLVQKRAEGSLTFGQGESSSVGKDISTLALSPWCTSIATLFFAIFRVINYYSEINLYSPELSDTYDYRLWRSSIILEKTIFYLKYILNIWNS